MTFSPGMKDIEGSPYLDDEFIKGSVFTKSKTEFVGVPLRYNVYNDDIEFMAEEDVIKALAAPEMTEKIEFGDYKIMYLPFIVVKKIKNGYFISLEEGKASLFSKPKVIFQEAKKAGAYVDAEPAKFIKKSDEYYIRIGMEAARPVTSKSDLYDVFPDHKKEIKSFIKDNKVKPHKREKLKKLVQYYNSL